MHIALTEPVRVQPQPFDSRELARILRPWGMLTWLVLVYLAYIAYDTVPTLLQHRSPPRMQSPVQAQPARIERERVVTKCIEPEAVTYSDNACAPGALSQHVILEPHPEPPARRQIAPAANLHQQVCKEVAEQLRRIVEKARLAPSASEHQWLQARGSEAFQEQLRLGC